MSKFQIIAIKTGKTDSYSIKYKDDKYCHESNLLKILKKETIYCFNNHYTFPNKNDFSEFVYDSKNDIDLYSLTLSNNRNIPVNISAIVGENGCGKSTLIELLYWINYIIGCHLELFEPNYEKSDKTLPDLELLYRIENDFHRIKIGNNNSGGISIQQLIFSLDNDNYKQPAKPDWQDISKQDLSNFFYSIVVNYSFYALNSDEIGNWTIPLFHKNDGYQTPIVLNPMRTKGTIEVNRERQLLSRRLQSNIFEPISEDIKVEDSLRNLANEKIAETLLIKKSVSFQFKSKDVKNFDDKYKDKLISALEAGDIFSMNKNQSYDDGFNHDALLYIYVKLKKMTKNYPKLYGGQKALNDLITLLKKVKDAKSHTVFKVKGAILHLKYYNEIYGKLAQIQGTAKNHIFNPIEDKFSINVEEYSKFIAEKISTEKFYINTSMMAFPSFFDVEIQPKKKEGNDKCKEDFPLDTFSSGEKQRINSLSSIVYHIININSAEIFQENKDFVLYKYVNVVLDEIELYYHPEWQRTFIKDMLDYLSKINPNNIDKIKGINIIFVTHSPFILSDIPSSHIIRLEKGAIKTNKPTFGANVHDLLADAFFMPNGFMGNYAKSKINLAIKWLNSEKPQENKEWNNNKILNFINMIGEPLIKNSLKKQYFEKFSDADAIDKEIERLQKLKDNKK